MLYILYKEYKLPVLSLLPLLENITGPNRIDSDYRMNVDIFTTSDGNLVVEKPKPWIERNYPLVQFSEMPYGGHFTAMEAPEPFALALREFISML